jgi:hypothetical protein
MDRARGRFLATGGPGAQARRQAGERSRPGTRPSSRDGSTYQRERLGLGPGVSSMVCSAWASAGRWKSPRELVTASEANRKASDREADVMEAGSEGCQAAGSRHDGRSRKAPPFAVRAMPPPGDENPSESTTGHCAARVLRGLAAGLKSAS